MLSVLLKLIKSVNYEVWNIWNLNCLKYGKWQRNYIYFGIIWTYFMLGTDKHVKNMFFIIK